MDRGDLSDITSDVNKQREAAVAELRKLLFSMEEGWESTGLGRSTFLQLVREGRIETVRVGRRRLVTAEALEAFVASLKAEDAA